eukprot:Seg4729.1 transcript_id=Seg4729.1/GoldUCD/mRNA.D3Y31 product="Sodium-dependent dopamine transporter" protein_id=Seg4729.1/GoldUCD/D3Y31
MGLFGDENGKKEETVVLKPMADDRAAKMEHDDDAIPERPTWGHKAEFILSCVGYTIGLGNVWRFPYLAYKSGGGAFIIPYCIMSICAGVPLYLMEVALGQYFAEGPIGAWRIICPLTRGIGYSMLMVSLLVSIYYNVIIAWILFYLFASFQKDVPWRKCDPAWASDKCREEFHIQGNGSFYNASSGQVKCLSGFHAAYKNITNNSTMQNMTVLSNCVSNFDLTSRVSPPDDYFNRYVLQRSSDIGELGSVSWQLALCLLLAWIVVYFCMCKGIKSAGKVVYFTAIFPYVVLFILLIRGLTLEGAADGVIHYLKPNFTNMLKPEVWGNAGSQLFYSLGPGFGSLLSYGSYNKFTNNCVKDAMFLGFMDVFSSTLAGVVIFSLLGYMSLKLRVDISKVVTSGPGLAFIIYPEGVSKMPISPLWSILFFFMLFTIGLDSQFGMMECVVTNLLDEYPKHLRKNEKLYILIVCIVCYLVAIPMVCQGGIYIFNLFDWQSAGFSLMFVALVEIITIGWFFGTERLNAMLVQMLGHKPSIWWTMCWKYFTPGILTMILVFAALGWKGISYDGIAYPGWAEFLGWVLALLTMMWIPIFAVKSIWEQEGTFRERLCRAIMPNEEAIRQKAKLNGVTYSSSTSGVLKQELV